jgi:hypothetical protein
MTTPRLCLLAIASAVLALPIAGCCGDVPDEEFNESYEDFITGDKLQMARESGETDKERCESACRLYLTNNDPVSILECEAVGAGEHVDTPWDPENKVATISCTAHYVEPGFCTGRRPQGHHEADVALGSRAAWFVANAHLERASITAFTELAAWLERRGAPADLISRCHAAAADEVVHADAITALARSEGSEVPTPTADPPADDLFAVALHNAVEGCVSEAFAALIAGHQARHADPALRELFATIAADELRHGQLAWDLHAWLFDQLTPAEQHAVADAQARALAELPALARSNAAATPLGLGWPAPTHAAGLARAFARQVAAAASLAA